MFGMGGSEIIVILIVALLFLGPEKLPGAAKQISKGIRDIKKQSRALQQQIESDDQIGGAIRDLKSALRGEEAPIRPRPLKQPDKAAVEAAAGLAAAEPGALTEGAPNLDEANAPPRVSLPATAGEPDAERPTTTDEDDAELAKMIRPAAGTIAKGASAEPSDPSAEPSTEPTHG